MRPSGLAAPHTPLDLGCTLVTRTGNGVSKAKRKGHGAGFFPWGNPRWPSGFVKYLRLERLGYFCFPSFQTTSTNERRQTRRGRFSRGVDTTFSRRSTRRKPWLPERRAVPCVTGTSRRTKAATPSGALGRRRSTLRAKPFLHRGTHVGPPILGDKQNSSYPFLEPI